MYIVVQLVVLYTLFIVNLFLDLGYWCIENDDWFNKNKNKRK